MFGKILVEYLIRQSKKGNKMTIAPTQTERFGTHYEFLIGIGNNYTAYLTMDDNALAELFTMFGEDENQVIK